MSEFADGRRLNGQISQSINIPLHAERFLLLYVYIIMKREETVCFNIKTAWHAISRMYNEQGQIHELSASVGYVLLSIDIQYGTPATKIGPMIGMEPKSLSRMLNSLEKDEMIYKEQDEKDKRLSKIFLTDKGKAKRELARKAVKKFNRQIREEISGQKLAIFFEVMQKINNILDQKRNTETTF
jgi:MarR family transcriptional regulator, organic hydroperoxide resistance regulator